MIKGLRYIHWRLHLKHVFVKEVTWLTATSYEREARMRREKFYVVTHNFIMNCSFSQWCFKLTEHYWKMTLYHFGNCLALVYVPYYLTYKYSGLQVSKEDFWDFLTLIQGYSRYNKGRYFFRSEYGAFWKCIQAGGIYIFTQLVKMLALATFFPTADNVGEEGFDVFGVCVISSLPNKFWWHEFRHKPQTLKSIAHYYFILWKNK